MFKTLLFWVLVKNCCTMCECIVLLFLWMLGSSSVLLSVVWGGMYVFECEWKIVVFIRRGGEGGFVRWWSGWFGWRHLFARSEACRLRCSFMGRVHVS